MYIYIYIYVLSTNTPQCIQSYQVIAFEEITIQMR